MLNTQGSIGTVRNDNFFAYKFNGLDLDGDPFEYDLLFARFLSPVRKDAPDIDQDFEDIKRDRVINYLKKNHSILNDFELESFINSLKEDRDNLYKDLNREQQNKERSKEKRSEKERDKGVDLS